MVAGPLFAAIVLTIGALGLILLERLHKRHRLRHASIAVTAIALLGLATLPAQTTALLRMDGLAIFFSSLSVLFGLCVLFASKERDATYYASILFSMVGMILAASANDILLVYFAIELVTVPTYVLVAFRKDRRGLEAGMKYFVVSIVASALMLLGVVLLALAANGTALASLASASGSLLLVGIAAFVAGLGFKLGIWPFNYWIPDVYEGSPPEIAALLAGATKKAAYAALIPIAILIAPRLLSWQIVLAVLAALSMTLPNLVALAQEDARRMVAYSIMTHAGFLLMGIALGTREGFAATMVHGFTHAFMAGGALLVLGAFAAHDLSRISQLRGMGARNPLLAASLTIFLLSLAGIPLLAGFSSKLFLFVTVAKDLWWLVALAIANSGIALYYYFRIIRALYGYDTAGKALKVRYGLMVAILICLFVTIFLGLYPQPLFWAAKTAVASVF